MRRVSLAVRLAVPLLAFAAVGCCAPCTVPGDPPDALRPLSLCLDRVTQPAPSLIAPVPHVRTVLDPEAPPRHISLAECIALAIENGRVNGESIRVLAYDPAVTATEIEQALSRFDARWQSSMTWSHTDQPAGVSALNSAFAAQQPNVQTAAFNSQLQKPLPTGGLAGITFNTDYQFSKEAASPDPSQAVFNPAYRPSLAFNFEQPLLQGYGVEINQLRTAHPVSVGARGSGQGILLARVAFDRSRAEFEQRVQDLVYSVEEAYWNLYCSYWTLYSREAAMLQAYREWLFGHYQYKEGRFTTQDLDQIEVQYQQFRAERLSALGNGFGTPGVLEAERQLRLTIGLPAEDGCRLVPSDTPTVAPYRPDWKSAADQALTLRPDLVRARQDVKAAQLALIRDKNDLLPDLRLVSSYDLNSLGSRLDGAGSENALRSLATNTFNNWSVGLRMEVPLGFREAHAAVRRAQLQLARQLASLRNQEEQALFELQRTYRQLTESIEQVKIQRARRTAAARQVAALQEQFRVGDKNFQLIVLLAAQRSLADALRDEQVAICEYNIALAQFERQKGTILVHDNVEIAEGPVPICVQQRASENIRQRQAALVLRARPLETQTDAPLLNAPVDNPIPLPQLFNGPRPPLELTPPE